MHTRTLPAFLLFFGLIFSSPGQAFCNGFFDPLTGAIQQSGNSMNHAISIGGDSFSNLVGLSRMIAKDIGLMAHRILTMSNKIEEMAHKIILTEKLVAKLIGIDIDICPRIENTVILTTPHHVASPKNPPTLNINQHKARQFLLYVSLSALFPEGETVISFIDRGNFQPGWEKSLNAIKKSEHEFTVFVSVKAIHRNNISNLSNSIKFNIK